MPTFTGELRLPGDEGYEQFRVERVFNARRPDRFPAAVLYAETEDDIVAAVRLARARGWRVAVRSGGHSWAAWSVRDDALLIDLGRFQEISYDAATGIVSVTPSVRGGEVLAPYLAARGRFFGGGHCPTVGVGGFLLQGGMGWNCRGWGWAAESVEAIDVVTAEGELVRADATTNADLFWAARGAGPGFFGVVTRFHLRTTPIRPVLRQTVHMYTMDHYDAVMTWLQRTHASVSPDVEIVAVAMAAPAELPELAGQHVLAVTGVAMSETDADAIAALAPLGGCPVRDAAVLRVDAAPTTMDELRAEQLRMNPENHRYAVDNAWIDGGPEHAVPALKNLFTTAPTEQTFTIWFSMAPLRELPDMALSLQTDIYVASYVIWRDPAEDERCRAWLDARMTELEPVTAGQYLGDSDLTRRSVRFVADEAWQRLCRIRARRDPDGLFVGYLAGDEVPLNTNHWQR